MFIKGLACRQAGFTIIELIVTIGIISVLSTLITINLVSTQRHTSVATAVLVLQSDLKQQQLKAMDGDTPGNYGIRFETDKYTLFRNSFVSGAAVNFAINLDGNLNFTTLGDVIFTKGSGEMMTGLNSLVIRDSNGSQRILNINRLGVVTSLN